MNKYEDKLCNNYSVVQNKQNELTELFGPTKAALLNSHTSRALTQNVI